MTEETETKTPELNDDLDLKRFLVEVHDPIKKHITTDFTLAKTQSEGLDQQDIELIIEMTNNAYYVKAKILETNYKKRWYWNKETQTYEHRIPNKEEQQIILAIAQKTFNTLLIRIKMLVIMAKNAQGNFLIKSAIEQETKEESVDSVIEEQKKGLAERLKKKMEKEQDT